MLPQFINLHDWKSAKPLDERRLRFNHDAHPEFHFIEGAFVCQVKTD
jgi:hypothetical protein